jgi:hypothetical protein
MNISKSNNNNHRGGVAQTVAGFLSGVKAFEYEVKLIRARQYVITRRWTAEEILNHCDFLEFKNREGFNVYCRPLDRFFVLLDDLTIETLKPLADIRPCLLMETSPGNFQAWVKLINMPNDRNHQLAIWRHIAAMFNADMNSAKPDQIGRLPGFHNMKPTYAPHYPVVKLHSFQDRYSTFAADHFAGEPPPPVVNNVAADKKQGDRSAFDFAIACSLVEKGKTDEEIRAYLEKKSSKAAGRRDDYIGRTIAKARRKTQPKLN